MFYELGFDAIQLTITCSKSTMKHTNLINVFTGRCHYDGVSPYIIAKKNSHGHDVIIVNFDACST